MSVEGRGVLGGLLLFLLEWLKVEGPRRKVEGRGWGRSRLLLTEGLATFLSVLWSSGS